MHPKTKLAAIALLAAVAALSSGCKAGQMEHAAHRAGQAWKSTSKHSGSSTDSAPVTTTKSGLREVHSPDHVADDMNLKPGQCHVKIKDAASGLVLPDPTCTPGAIDPAVTQSNIQSTICKSGYTDTIRPPASDTDKFKAASYDAYGLKASDTVEEDHLVSLQLGGANAESNLFVEPNKAGAKGTTNPKDAVENKLKDGVCDGKVSLGTAQKLIATDWTTALDKAGLDD